MAAENRNAPLGQRHDWPRAEVAIAPLGLPGTLVHSAAGQHIVLFAHSSGSSRLVTERLALATEWVRSGELRGRTHRLLRGQHGPRRRSGGGDPDRPPDRCHRVPRRRPGSRRRRAPAGPGGDTPDRRRLAALDVPRLEIAASAKAEDVWTRARPHIIPEAEVVGVYEQ
ncbi:hypothetical protein [Microvirga aerophila]|uniref:Uncharacterized protein n=1 Tax=Microvirga aerophila TaxID=670291 RepID=A0A512BZJ5_9HYPH|nr:hypothetical protein [Microvirga aerophila]GEO17373.1 hypothetical protein MAE02_50690 [Microvirga aerophila]